MRCPLPVGEREFDKASFEKATSKQLKLKRGKGSQRQAQLAVMAESTPLENIETGVRSRQCRYFKMKVIADHSADTIFELVQKNFDQKSIVFSDKSASYVDIAQHVGMHITEKSDANTTRKTLHLVHIAISNAKRALLGIFHKIKGKYLQNYLNPRALKLVCGGADFCDKLNRRYFRDRIFDRLTLAVAKSYW